MQLQPVDVLLVDERMYEAQHKLLTTVSPRKSSRPARDCPGQARVTAC